MSRHNFFRSTQRQRYLARQFKNPYFDRPKKRPWRRLIAFGAGVLFLGSLIVFFLRAPAFAIQDVRVTGTEAIAPSAIEEMTKIYLDERYLGFFKHRNRFLFDAEILKERLAERYAFETLEIARDGNTLFIDLKERHSELVWNTRGKHYLADLQGIIIRELSSEEFTTITAITSTPRPPPIFVDMNGAEAVIGQSVLPASDIERTFHFHARLEEQGIALTETRVDRVAGQWMSVRATLGYDILFDPTQDVDTQAANLAVLLRDTVKDPSKLQYIDLRFGDHVYFK
jgi:hypothetical protein